MFVARKKMIMNQLRLLEILRDQKEELKGFAEQHFCERQEESEIKMNSKKAQVVIGVRRSGKSVLCYNALSKAGVSYAYANFDDERLSKLTSDELNDVLRCLYQIYGDVTHLFLDEVQNIDGWHYFVNRMLRQGMKVILTGSNAKLLSSELSTHLTGRYNDIALLPFSFKEFCKIKAVDLSDSTTRTDALLRRAFDEYLQSGGFPEIVNGEEDAEEYIDDLAENIIGRDIIQRFKVRYKDAFIKIANHMMNVAPCEVVYTTLQEDFNIKSDHTVQNYISYLYQAYLLIQINKYSVKSKERIRNSKCYAVDVAFMNARKDAFAGENLGWRLETVVLLELKRRYPLGYDIYYLKENSFEADFVVCRRSTVLEIIQVSYDIEAPKTYRREINGLIRASEITHCDNLKLITAYTEKTVTEQAKKIEILPCYKWLLR